MMTRKIAVAVIMIFVIQTGRPQSNHIDSLKVALRQTRNDTAKIGLLSELNVLYQQSKPDSAYEYANILLELSRKLDYPLSEVFAYSRMAYALLDLGQYPKSLQAIQAGIPLAQDPGSERNIVPDRYDYIEELPTSSMTPRLKRLNALADILQIEGILYSNRQDYRREISLDSQVLELSNVTGNLFLKSRTQITMSIAYSRLGIQDTALLLLDSAYQLSRQLNFKRFVASIFLNKGRIYRAIHSNEKAAAYFREAIKEGREEYPRGAAAASIENGALFSLPSGKDSALWYAYSALDMATRMKAPDLIMRADTLLGSVYREIGKNDSAVKYLAIIIKMKDTLFNARQGQQFDVMEFAQQQKDQELLNAQKTYKNRLILYGVLTWACIFLVIAAILWRNNRNVQRAYALLHRQKQETENQKNKAEATLKELKATQTQLIQSEKMASLGEMSAGIAHEIQNPLNFVNNFSELNAELISELKAGLSQESLSSSGSEMSKEILQNLEDNSKKITHHGKRAETIVRGMLQHSNLGTAKKELVDINELIQEYLKFSYHSYRARDKDFQCEMNCRLNVDPAEIYVVPQDLGRVLLNLFNNSFYAMSAKKRLHPDYQPELAVNTVLADNRVQITIRDNGSGISEKNRDKIFQPFFTTKPAGQGTGLGLSLAYDIITKEHGGTIRVESKETEYTEFEIQIPMK